MDSNFIDRRLNGRHKSLANRERFKRRYLAHIKQRLARDVRRPRQQAVEHRAVDICALAGPLPRQQRQQHR